MLMSAGGDEVFCLSLIGCRPSTPSVKFCRSVSADTKVEGESFNETFTLLSSFSGGGWTRTSDLQVMSLASYQLLHSAISYLRLQRYNKSEPKARKIL